MELEQWEIIPDGHDDAAGRLVKEGKRSYSYSWLDKVSSVKENGVEVASFTYHMDGQIATAKANGRTFVLKNRTAPANIWEMRKKEELERGEKTHEEKPVCVLGIFVHFDSLGRPGKGGEDGKIQSVN